jgi:hypothetical protein
MLTGILRVEGTGAGSAIALYCSAGLGASVYLAVLQKAKRSNRGSSLYTCMVGILKIKKKPMALNPSIDLKQSIPKVNNQAYFPG